MARSSVTSPCFTAIGCRSLGLARVKGAWSLGLLQQPPTEVATRTTARRVSIGRAAERTREPGSAEIMIVLPSIPTRRQSRYRHRSGRLAHAQDCDHRRDSFAQAGPYLRRMAR